MNIKFVFVIGFLLVSALAEDQTVEPEKPLQPEKLSKPEQVSEPEKAASAEAKVEVNLGDVKMNDENVNKEIVEDIENTDNGVKASGKDNFSKTTFKLDFKQSNTS